MPNVKNIQFENSGVYLLGLILLAISGFWNSYFLKLFGDSEDFNYYFHFHALMAGTWILMLIAQPFLIRKRKLELHKTIGKLSFIVIPLFIISVVLLFHSQHTAEEAQLGRRMLTPLRDLIIISVAFFIAIKYRSIPSIHARGMIATGVVFIEPALVRLIWQTTHFRLTYLVAILMVYALLITLMVKERKQKIGRWVFPLITLLYLIGHSIRLSSIQIKFLDDLAKWFVQLPLT